MNLKTFNRKKFSMDMLHHRVTIKRLSRRKYACLVGEKSNGVIINHIENCRTDPKPELFYNACMVMGKKIEDYFE